jgi:ABC-2 type transport system ATP-binding protein
LAIYADKADVDALLATHEEFSTAKSKNKIFTRFVQRKPEKVGIATLIGNPEVIILDEPFANLPNHTIPIKKIIKDLADNPEVTVLVSSHDLQHTVEVTGL